MANCIKRFSKKMKVFKWIIFYTTFRILTISSYVLLIVGPLLICVAFLTYLERKVIAAVQYRKGT